MRELVRVFGREDLPTVGELDPYLLGATSSAFGGPAEHGVRDRYVARTANRVDTRLAEALTGSRMVIVVGPSKAGKTRTLFEAVHAFDPGARVVWPVHGGIGELAVDPRLAASADTVVVWLDDLHEYLSGPNSLTPAELARLTARRGRTLVVATLRSEMRAQLRGDGELGRETRMLLEQALLIDLASTSDDPAESAAAAAAYPGQAFDGYGLGEVLAGAPELLARYDDARAADPIEHAVIAVAVDWARIGRSEPIPEAALTDFAIQWLRETRPELDTTDETVRAAITAARTPPQGAGRAAALHTRYLDGGMRGYRPFDYLVAADGGQNGHSRRPIPDAFWHRATHDADPEILTTVGTVAFFRANTSIAGTLWRKAADAGHLDAMWNLGVLLTEQGDRAEAEDWYRKAADAGHPGAMMSLGVLLVERGDGVEAESWLRNASDTGFPGAMYNLAVLLTQQGDLAEAEDWYRKAADAGNPDAMYNLGVRLNKRGDREGAEAWYRKAADVGHLGAMYNLGVLLVKRGERAEAEAWYRKAAYVGHSGAMSNLGVLLVKRGERAEAESWLRKSADAGYPDGMYSLGVLLVEREDRAEAEGWYRKAADAGHPDAMSNLGVLLAERGDGVEAESWLRKAADTGHSGAMDNLGVLLYERGDRKGAESWLRKAADAGHSGAVDNLRALLYEPGDEKAAESLLRKAADAGNLHAMAILGILLDDWEDQQNQKRKFWLRSADDGASS
ncbi:tetratricopeptide repeat protein [Nocardia nepalensis]|uniref:tetratricopeptide repeat protein n=1 Tax=Nocardia nepalensis TaxID=3375448 RepID=UPI003B67084C